MVLRPKLNALQLPPISINVNRISFSIDGVDIPNAAQYYDTLSRVFSYTPSQSLAYKLHNAKLKVFNNTGDSAFASTDFTVSSFFSVAPYTFLFDSKSPNFRFQSNVNRVDLKGDFNSGGNSPMADPDSDGVFTFTTNLDVNNPNEYTVIVNSGSYINDPDNPLLSLNHRTIAIKRMLRIPEFRDIMPSSEKVFSFPKDSVTISAKLFRSDSGVVIKTDSIKATYDGLPVTARWVNGASGVITVSVSVANPSEGRHTIKIFAQDFNQNKAKPVSWTFSVIGTTPGFYAVDNEGDDRGAGSYIYPNGVTEGSADIEVVKVRTTSGLDTLLFSIKLKTIAAESRIGFSLVNRIDGSFTDALQNVELKIPEWNNRGVSLILAKPGTSFFNGVEENRLFISREPLTTSIAITPDAAALNNGEFSFALPLANLEDILGTYESTWYLTAYSYLKQDAEALEITTALGGSADTEDPDVYDVFGISWDKIQERLLANYNNPTQIGGKRIAVIGSEFRGAVAVSPNSINPQLALVPAISVYAGGGVLYQDTVRVTGFADVAPGSSITLKVNNNATIVTTNTAKIFSLLATLEEGVNRITAELNFNGRIVRSKSIFYTYEKSHSPVAIITTLINGTQTSLDASSSTDPDGGVLTYLWTQDAGNPQPVTIGNTSNASINFSKPVKKGHYYFTVQVTDNTNLKSWARAVVLVTDTGMYTPDLSTFHARWIDTAVIYCVFVRTFDAAGTFNSVKNRLDEIRDLGIDCIWFLPIHPTTGNLGPDNPGYATTNYMDVLATYGTKDEFRQLVNSAHEKGIKVILDHVIQHTSDLHPFMLDANKFKQHSPYYPYYYWDANNNFQFLFTWVDLPSLNYDNKITRDYLIKAAKYWTQEFNTDGFRCDVAWAINDLRPQGPAYWKTWRSALKSMKPDALLLAEADAAATRYFDGKFDAAYDYGWFNSVRSLIAGTSQINALDSVIAYYSSAAHPKHGLPFKYLENQDEQRFIEAFGVASTKLAAALLFASPGVPMLYAGQEVGELSFRGVINWNDPNVLRPFYKKLIAIRSGEKALSGGSYTRVQTSRPQEVYSFLRLADSSNVICNYNFSPDSFTVTLNVPIRRLSFDSTATFYLNDVLNNKSYMVTGIQLKNYQIGIQGKSAQILVLSKTPITSTYDAVQKQIPTAYELMQNYPNPFNPSTTIRYDLPFESKVKLEVFNILGQRVTTLVDTRETAGVHAAVFNAERYASGLYLVRLDTEPLNGSKRFSSVKKMLLVK
ncbi:MAG: T9SS type A sorting domain-containing protein [Ignavibacteriales bacterium]|nr:T9SS type A sorting domain-containing protein [Ignavibacteriales bacterium]